MRWTGTARPGCPFRPQTRPRLRPESTAASLIGPLAAEEDDDADPTAFVLATSGSTGEPKGALLPVSAVRASAAATQSRLGGPGTWLLALPAQHIAGLQVLLRSLLADTVARRHGSAGRVLAQGFRRRHR